MSIKKIKKISKEEIDPYDICFDNEEVIFSITSIAYNKTFNVTISIEAEYIAQKLYLSVEVINRYFGRFFSNRIKMSSDDAQDFKIKLIDAVWDFLSSRLVSDRDKRFWIYDGWIYETKREYEDNEVRLLILEEIDKERQKFERLKQKFDLGLDQRLITARRERIPEEARIEVWRRDECKCVKCGSQENLECQLPSP